MWDRLKNWLRRWLGIEIEDARQALDDFARKYEDVTADNIAADIAWKLSMLTFADSTMRVTDENGDEALTDRAQLISDALNGVWQNDASWIAAQALGKGGMLLIPTVTDGGVIVNAVDQNRLAIIRMRGRRIASAAVVVDEIWENSRKYLLLAHYEMVGNDQVIRYRAIEDGGTAVEMTAFEKWANITPEITIANTDRLLFAYVRSPRDNRTIDRRYGVPITYGAQSLIEELATHAATYRKEYKLTSPILGLDATLWKRRKRRTVNGDAAQPDDITINDIQRTVQDGDTPFIPVETMSLDGKTPWMYYAPAIRHEAMDARYNYLCRRIEKACGLSQGILTDRKTMNYANRDEVRAAQYDTFSVVKAMRNQIEAAMNDLAYAIDVLAERFGLTPAGGRDRYTIAFDWGMSLLESTEQTFHQYAELHAAKLMRGAELRAWVTGESLEEAQAVVDEIEKSGAGKSAIDRILADTETAGDE